MRFQLLGWPANHPQAHPSGTPVYAGGRKLLGIARSSQTGAGQSIPSSPYSEAYRLGAGKGAGFRAGFVHLQKGFPDFCLLLTTFEVATWRFVVRFSPSRSKTRSPCECFGAIVSAPAELMQGAIAERELRDQEAERLRITGWPSSLSILIFKGGEGLAFPLPPPFIEKRRGGHCSRVLG